MKQLPDLGKAARFFKVSVELEKVSPETIMGFSIKNGLKEGRTMETIMMLAEQSKDNREGIKRLIGEETLKDIESLFIHQ